MHLLIVLLAYKKRECSRRQKKKPPKKQNKNLSQMPFVSKFHFFLHCLTNQIMPTEALHCGESNTKPYRAGKRLNIKAPELMSPQRKRQAFSTKLEKPPHV